MRTWFSNGFVGRGKAGGIVAAERASAHCGCRPDEAPPFVEGTGKEEATRKQPLNAEVNG